MSFSVRHSVRPVLTAYRSLSRAVYTWLARRMVASAGPVFRVNGFSRLTSTTFVGNNVHMNGMHIMGKGKVRIGNNFHSGIECMMITDTHDYDHGETLPYGKTLIVRDIIIEDNVWLGSRVTILGGARIGEGAIIQAGSVVVKSIPACAIAGGHPAKVFKYRDISHYMKLRTGTDPWPEEIGIRIRENGRTEPPESGNDSMSPTQKSGHPDE